MKKAATGAAKSTASHVLQRTAIVSQVGTHVMPDAPAYRAGNCFIQGFKNERGSWRGGQLPYRRLSSRGLSPVGGAVAHGAGLAVATGHDRPDRIVMLSMDLQLQVTPQIGHASLTQGAGHRHRAAVCPGQQQHPSLVVGAR